MARIVGRVVVHESGKAVSDLLVVVYAPEVPERRAPTREQVLAGRRLGSVLTNAGGAFEIDAHADAGVSVGMAIWKPTLAEPKLLHVAAEMRRIGAGTESFLIRVPAEALGLNGTNAPPSPPQPDARALDRIRATFARRAVLSGAIAEVATAQLEAGSATDQRVAHHMDDFTAQLSMVPPEQQRSASFVPAGGSLRTAARAAIDLGVQRVTTQPTTLRLRVTQEQLEKLRVGPETSPGSSLSAEGLDPIAFGESSPGGSASLQRRSMVDSACRSSALPLDGCLPGSTTEGSVIVPPSSNGDANVFAIPQLGRYITSILSGPPALGEKGRPGAADVQHNVDSLDLRGGPADRPSVYDFYRLQVATSSVWQEVFDGGLLAAAREVYQRYVNLQHGPELTGAVIGLPFLLKKFERDRRVDPPSDVTQVFAVTPEQWLALSPDEQADLVGIATDYLAPVVTAVPLPIPAIPGVPPGLIDSITLDVVTHAENDARRALRRRGEQILRWADAKNDSSFRGLHKIIDDLDARLREPHSFVSFAARPGEYSLNFGLVLHFQQQWQPLGNQFGRLVRTLPLAPKEARKYSTRIVAKQSRARKEVESSMQSHKSETATTQRAEAEVVMEAQTKTNFKLSASGGLNMKLGSVSGSLEVGREASSLARETKKQFREAVVRAAEEYKNERSVEVNTSESVESESQQSGEISNPNDELAVTYLFYELQRRFRIREFLNRAVPVVLVAQPVPAPHEIDEAWLVAHDWILRRVLLDDSFGPALSYLTTKVPSEERRLEVLRRDLARQQELADRLQDELLVAKQSSGRRYVALEKAMEDRAVEAGREGGMLQGAFDYFLGGGGDADERARLREEAAKDATERVARDEREVQDRLDREVTALQAARNSYAKTLADHLACRAQVSRLRVHVKQNILHYMQAIWSHEPTDQRVLRLLNVEAPLLSISRTYSLVSVAARPNSMAGLPAFDLTAAVTLHPPAAATTTLGEIAELDDLLGFHGNYMIFALKQSNALTDHLRTPYADAATGVRDPDVDADVTPAEFARYACCLQQSLPANEFAALLDSLQAEYESLLRIEQATTEEIVLPTGELAIEALPSSQPILEDFKLRHRAAHARRAEAESRFAELENLRAAARMIAGERGDPNVDTTIVVDGPATPVIPVVP